jgi:pilus assembly protein Flp/PilA
MRVAGRKARVVRDGRSPTPVPDRCHTEKVLPAMAVQPLADADPCATIATRPFDGRAGRHGRPKQGVPMDFVKWLTSRSEEGQGLAEYALILALIAIVAIVALIFLGSQVSSILSTVGTSI